MPCGLPGSGSLRGPAGETSPRRGSFAIRQASQRVVGTVVIRRRVRAVVVPAVLWTVSALTVGYFIMRAESGSRGLTAVRADDGGDVLPLWRAEDSTIADPAVATYCGQIKTGSPAPTGWVSTAS